MDYSSKYRSKVILPTKFVSNLHIVVEARSTSRTKRGAEHPNIPNGYDCVVGSDPNNANETIDTCNYYHYCGKETTLNEKWSAGTCKLHWWLILIVSLILMIPFVCFGLGIIYKKRSTINNKLCMPVLNFILGN